MSVANGDVQKKTFTRWMNARLAKRDEECVTDLFYDLRDGCKLLQLLAILTDQSYEIDLEFSRHSHIINITRVLDILRSHSISTDNINASLIVDGDTKSTMELIWRIIFYWQMEKVFFRIGLLNTSLFDIKPDSSSQSENGPNCLHADIIDSATNIITDTFDISDKDYIHRLDRVCCDLTKSYTRSSHLNVELLYKIILKIMLFWCRYRIQDYKDSCLREVSNFHTDWCDGIIFSALLHRCLSALFDYNKHIQTRRDVEQRLEFVFCLGQEYLNISKLLDPQDVKLEKVDEKSILIYVSTLIELVEIQPDYISTNTNFLNNMLFVAPVKEATHNVLISVCRLLDWFLSNEDILQTFRFLADSFNTKSFVYLRELYLKYKSFAEEYFLRIKRVEQVATVFSRHPAISAECSSQVGEYFMSSYEQLKNKSTSFGSSLQIFDQLLLSNLVRCHSFELADIKECLTNLENEISLSVALSLNTSVIDMALKHNRDVTSAIHSIDDRVSVVFDFHCVSVMEYHSSQSEDCIDINSDLASIEDQINALRMRWQFVNDWVTNRSDCLTSLSNLWPSLQTTLVELEQSMSDGELTLRQLQSNPSNDLSLLKEQSVTIQEEESKLQTLSQRLTSIQPSVSSLLSILLRHSHADMHEELSLRVETLHDRLTCLSHIVDACLSRFRYIIPSSTSNSVSNSSLSTHNSSTRQIVSSVVDSKLFSNTYYSTKSGNNNTIAQGTCLQAEFHTLLQLVSEWCVKCRHLCNTDPTTVESLTVHLQHLNTQLNHWSDNVCNQIKELKRLAHLLSFDMNGSSRESKIELELERIDIEYHDLRKHLLHARDYTDYIVEREQFYAQIQHLKHATDSIENFLTTKWPVSTSGLQKMQLIRDLDERKPELTQLEECIMRVTARAKDLISLGHEDSELLESEMDVVLQRCENLTISFNKAIDEAKNMPFDRPKHISLSIETFRCDLDIFKNEMVSKVFGFASIEEMDFNNSFLQNHEIKLCTKQTELSKFRSECEYLIAEGDTDLEILLNNLSSDFNTQLMLVSNQLNTYKQAFDELYKCFESIKQLRADFNEFNINLEVLQNQKRCMQTIDQIVNKLKEFKDILHSDFKSKLKSLDIQLSQFRDKYDVFIINSSDNNLTLVKDLNTNYSELSDQWQQFCSLCDSLFSETHGVQCTCSKLNEMRVAILGGISMLAELENNYVHSEIICLKQASDFLERFQILSDEIEKSDAIYETLSKNIGEYRSLFDDAMTQVFVDWGLKIVYIREYNSTCQEAVNYSSELKKYLFAELSWLDRVEFKMQKYSIHKGNVQIYQDLKSFFENYPSDRLVNIQEKCVGLQKLNVIDENIYTEIDNVLFKWTNLRALYSDNIIWKLDFVKLITDQLNTLRNAFSVFKSVQTNQKFLNKTTSFRLSTRKYIGANSDQMSRQTQIRIEELESLLLEEKTLCDEKRDFKLTSNIEDIESYFDKINSCYQNCIIFAKNFKQHSEKDSSFVNHKTSEKNLKTGVVYRSKSFTARSSNLQRLQSKLLSMKSSYNKAVSDLEQLRNNISSVYKLYSILDRIENHSDLNRHDGCAESMAHLSQDYYSVLNSQIYSELNVSSTMLDRIAHAKKILDSNNYEDKSNPSLSIKDEYPSLNSTFSESAISKNDHNILKHLKITTVVSIAVNNTPMSIENIPISVFKPSLIDSERQPNTQLLSVGQTETQRALNPLHSTSMFTTLAAIDVHTTHSVSMQSKHKDVASVTNISLSNIISTASENAQLSIVKPASDFSSKSHTQFKSTERISSSNTKIPAEYSVIFGSGSISSQIGPKTESKSAPSIAENYDKIHAESLIDKCEDSITNLMSILNNKWLDNSNFESTTRNGVVESGKIGNRSEFLTTQNHYPSTHSLCIANPNAVPHITSSHPSLSLLSSKHALHANTSAIVQENNQQPIIQRDQLVTFCETSIASQNFYSKGLRSTSLCLFSHSYTNSPTASLSCTVVVCTSLTSISHIGTVPSSCCCEKTDGVIGRVIQSSRKSSAQLSISESKHSNVRSDISICDDAMTTGSNCNSLVITFDSKLTSVYEHIIQLDNSALDLCQIVDPNYRLHFCDVLKRIEDIESEIIKSIEQCDIYWLHICESFMNLVSFDYLRIKLSEVKLRWATLKASECIIRTVFNRLESIETSLSLQLDECHRWYVRLNICLNSLSDFFYTHKKVKFEIRERETELQEVCTILSHFSPNNKGRLWDICRNLVQHISKLRTKLNEIMAENSDVQSFSDNLDDIDVKLNDMKSSIAVLYRRVVRLAASSVPYDTKQSRLDAFNDIKNDMSNVKIDFDNLAHVIEVKEDDKAKESLRHLNQQWLQLERCYDTKYNLISYYVDNLKKLEESIYQFCDWLYHVEIKISNMDNEFNKWKSIWQEQFLIENREKSNDDYSISTRNNSDRTGSGIGKIGEKYFAKDDSNMIKEQNRQLEILRQFHRSLEKDVTNKQSLYTSITNSVCKATNNMASTEISDFLERLDNVNRRWRAVLSEISAYRERICILEDEIFIFTTTNDLFIWTEHALNLLAQNITQNPSDENQLRLLLSSANTILPELNEKRDLYHKLNWPERKFKHFIKLSQINVNLNKISCDLPLFVRETTERLERVRALIQITSDLSKCLQVQCQTISTHFSINPVPSQHFLSIDSKFSSMSEITNENSLNEFLTSQQKKYKTFCILYDELERNCSLSNHIVIDNLKTLVVEVKRLWISLNEVFHGHCRSTAVIPTSTTRSDLITSTESISLKQIAAKGIGVISPTKGTAKKNKADTKNSFKYLSRSISPNFKHHQNRYVIRSQSSAENIVSAKSPQFHSSHPVDVTSIVPGCSSDAITSTFPVVTVTAAHSNQLILQNLIEELESKWERSNGDRHNNSHSSYPGFTTEEWKKFQTELCLLLSGMELQADRLTAMSASDIRSIKQKDFYLLMCENIEYFEHKLSVFVACTQYIVNNQSFITNEGNHITHSNPVSCFDIINSSYSNESYSTIYSDALKHIGERWLNLRARIDSRRRILINDKSSVSVDRIDHEVDCFLTWLSEVELKLSSLEKTRFSNISDHCLQQKLLTDFQDIQNEISAYRDDYALLMSFETNPRAHIDGHEKQTSSTAVDSMQSNLQQKLDQMNKRWDSLKSRTAAIKNQIECCVSVEGPDSLLLSLRDLVEWMMAKDTELANIGLIHGDTSRLLIQQSKVRGILNEINKRQDLIESKLRAVRLLDTEVFSDKSIDKNQDSANRNASSNATHQPELLGQKPKSDDSHPCLIESIQREATVLSDGWLQLRHQTEICQHKLHFTLMRMNALENSLKQMHVAFDELNPSIKRSPSSYRACLEKLETVTRSSGEKEFDSDTVVSPSQMLNLHKILDNIHDQVARLASNGVLLPTDCINQIESVSERFRYLNVIYDGHTQIGSDVSQNKKIPETSASPNHVLRVLSDQSIVPPWRRLIQAETGVPYYVNEANGQWQWTHPRMHALLHDLQIEYSPSRVRFCAYRVAFKLRFLQRVLRLNCLNVTSVCNLIESLPVCIHAHANVGVVDILNILNTIHRSSDVKSPNIHRSLTSLSSIEDSSASIPLVVELCLNLILLIFDTEHLGFVRGLCLKVLLIVLSDGYPEEKYKQLFLIMSGSTEQSIEPYDLHRLLSDLLCLPDFLDDVQAFGGRDPEASVLSCLHQQEQHLATMCTNAQLSFSLHMHVFLQWLRREPQCLVWLAVLHRITISENIEHENSQCSVCNRAPITGFRYRCLKCFNYDVCQMCFFSGLLSKSHKHSHPMHEYCTESSSSDNLKDFTQSLRNRLKSKRNYNKNIKLGYLPITLDSQMQNSLSPLTRNLSRRYCSLPAKSLNDDNSSMLFSDSDNEHLLIQNYCRNLNSFYNNHERRYATIGAIKHISPDQKDNQNRHNSLDINFDADRYAHFQTPRISAYEPCLSNCDSSGYHHTQPALTCASTGGLPAVTVPDDSQPVTAPSTSSSCSRMLSEARLLREHKSRLENRMSLLEQHNRALAEQLTRLHLLVYRDRSPIVSSAPCVSVAAEHSYNANVNISTRDEFGKTVDEMVNCLQKSGIESSKL